MSTHNLRYDPLMVDAFALRAAIVRILSDHGVNPTQPLVGDLAGYAARMALAADLGHTISAATIDGVAHALNKEVWLDDTPGTGRAYPAAHRYGSRKRS